MKTPLSVVLGKKIRIYGKYSINPKERERENGKELKEEIVDHNPTI